MDLYITGTMMKNRAPKGIAIAKSSQTYKEMAGGDFKRHLFVYKNGGEDHSTGLVCWKDRGMVYCLTNDTNTMERD